MKLKNAIELNQGFLNDPERMKSLNALVVAVNEYYHAEPILGKVENVVKMSKSIERAKAKYKDDAELITLLNQIRLLIHSVSSFVFEAHTYKLGEEFDDLMARIEKDKNKNNQ